jgi:hypothetical protein
MLNSTPIAHSQHRLPLLICKFFGWLLLLLAGCQDATRQVDQPVAPLMETAPAVPNVPKLSPENFVEFAAEWDSIL